MSLASPSIILDGAGNVRMVIGAAGGKYIATALSQVNNMYLLSEPIEWKIFSYIRQLAKSFLKIKAFIILF